MSVACRAFLSTGVLHGAITAPYSGLDDPTPELQWLLSKIALIARSLEESRAVGTRGGERNEAYESITDAQRRS